jgi:hypothetical protein
MTHAPAILRRFYEVHGVGVRVETVEPAVLEAMDLRLRAFRSEPVREPDLRLEFVVDGLGGSEPPPVGGRPVYDTPHGSLHYLPEEDVLYGELGGVALRCEPSRGIARLSTAVFGGRALYLATHPLATVSLMELLERHGLFSLHAACLATEDGGGALIAGPSGAGKSTLALALARAGMHLVSDDIVFLSLGNGGAAVRALGFADAVGLSERAGRSFVELQGLLDEAPADGFPKRLHRIEELFGRPIRSDCRPDALVFPEVAPDAPSAIGQLDPRDALLRLVPDVLLTEPTATQAHLAAIGALLGEVRCYALRSGTDLERAAYLVRRVI